jgi:glycosyltransferase involved in cell wall biosynthesis
VRFHGRVPHARVPRWLAACDLALAPYDPATFPAGRVAYSTLKIPEAMACARAVASVPSGNVLRLIRHGQDGLLLDNTRAAWTALFRELPSREALDALGRAGRLSVRGLTWARTAEGYERFVTSLLNRTPRTPA